MKALKYYNFIIIKKYFISISYLSCQNHSFLEDPFLGDFSFFSYKSGMSPRHIFSPSLPLSLYIAMKKHFTIILYFSKRQKTSFYRNYLGDIKNTYCYTIYFFSPYIYIQFIYTNHHTRPFSPFLMMSFMSFMIFLLLILLCLPATFLDSPIHTKSNFTHTKTIQKIHTTFDNIQIPIQTSKGKQMYVYKCLYRAEIPRQIFLCLMY